MRVVLEKEELFHNSTWEELPTLLVDPLHILAHIRAQFEFILRFHGKQMTHLSMNQLYLRLYLLSKVPRPVWFVALSISGCIITAYHKDFCFVLLTCTNNLQQYDTKTKDIWFYWKFPKYYILWWHITIAHEQHYKHNVKVCKAFISLCVVSVQVSA